MFKNILIRHFFEFKHMNDAILHAKLYVHVRIIQFIYTLCIVLVCRSRILGKDLLDSALSGFGYISPIGADDRQSVVARLFGKAVARIGMGVGETEIGFDIVDRCAIEQVSSTDNEYESLVGGWLDTQQAYAGEAESVGTER